MVWDETNFQQVWTIFWWFSFSPPALGDGSSRWSCFSNLLFWSESDNIIFLHDTRLATVTRDGIPNEKTLAFCLEVWTIAKNHLRSAFDLKAFAWMPNAACQTYSAFLAFLYFQVFLGKNTIFVISVTDSDKLPYTITVYLKA